MRGDSGGWFRIRIGSLDQRVELRSQRRRYGGRQWYFVCPVTARLVAVLWKPPGAKSFCSRQTWGRQVAYLSQFSDVTSRAHLGKAKIKALLIADEDPDAWDLPPKPKWMRWSTYNRYVERFDRYERHLDYGCAALAARLKKTL